MRPGSLYPARGLGAELEFDSEEARSLRESAAVAAARAKEAARLGAEYTSRMLTKLGDQKKALEAKYGARAVAGLFLGLSIGRRAPTFAMWLGYLSLAIFANERAKAYKRGEIQTIRDIFRETTPSTASPPAGTVTSAAPVLIPDAAPALSGFYTRTRPRARILQTRAQILRVR